jgi:hypothetical protein
MSATNGSRGRSARLDRAGVSGVVDSWLPADIEGADIVRAAVARRLAAELDAPELQSYVVAKLASTLIAVVAEIDGTREVARAKPSRAELRQLLDDVR